MENPDHLEYAGFWVRTWAALIDSVLLIVILFPLLTVIYGWTYWESTKFVQGPADFLLSWIAPAIVVLVFWAVKQATPGKMAVSTRIVDAKTGGNPTTTQLVIRYLGYYVSMIPLFLGIIWIAFDRRKQGWHDKIAGTVVVRQKGGSTEAVKFNHN
ncbi:MAG: hypothetical protein A3I66_10665 [Burkholderiales bacterium RIFCSPLOWO2_02_FULL_57_36]|nr:MAG: hypothetical protein A3I66_10665 [Burkholderiales bacterium RIFCSPLOWO2_02_FULL_57_36]